MSLSYYVPDPTSPATFRADAPLGAGRMNFLASNISLLQQRNARRVVASHVGIQNWSAQPLTAVVPGTGYRQEYVNWNLGRKSGGCHLCLGSIIVPGPYPGSTAMPGLIVKCRARVHTLGDTANLVLVVTAGHGVALDANVVGTGGTSVTSVIMAATSFGVGVSGTALMDPPAPRTFTPSATDRGTAYLLTLWFGGYMTSVPGDQADVTGITVYLCPPSESP